MWHGRDAHARWNNDLCLHGLQTPLQHTASTRRSSASLAGRARRTLGQLGQVRAAGAGQAADVKLALALVADDHRARPEAVAQKVWALAQHAAAGRGRRVDRRRRRARPAAPAGPQSRPARGMLAGSRAGALPPATAVQRCAAHAMQQCAEASASRAACTQQPRSNFANCKLPCYLSAVFLPFLLPKELSLQHFLGIIKSWSAGPRCASSAPRALHVMNAGRRQRRTGRRPAPRRRRAPRGSAPAPPPQRPA